MKYAVIDIQAEKVSLYVIESKNKSLELKQKLELKGIDELKTLIQEHEFRDIGLWIVSLTLADLSFRILKFPFGDKSKIRRVLPLELENMLLLRADEIVYDFRVKKTGTSDFEVELICVEKVILVKTLQALKDGGVSVSAVTSLDFILGSYMGSVEPSLDERSTAAKTVCNDPGINLMSREFFVVQTKPEIRQKILLAYGLTVIFLSLICASFLFDIRSLKIKNSAYQSAVTKVYTTLFPGSKAVGEYYQLQAKFKQVKDKNDFMPHTAGLEFLRFVSGASLGGLDIESFKLDEKFLEVNGGCHTLSDVEDFKKKIEAYVDHSADLESRKSPDGQFIFRIKTESKK